MSEAPKRDKFASLAARNQQQQQQQPAAQRVASPKRDKFASLAARQQGSSGGAVSGSSGSGIAAGGKFAKLQQKQQQQQQEATSSDGASSAAAAAVEAQRVAKQQRKEALLVRIRQQRQVLKDMEKAEGMVWNLIHLAKETAEGLADLKPPQQDDTAETPINLSVISQNYRNTLSQIHGLLKPHARLVKAYENHQIDAEDQDNDGEEERDDQGEQSDQQQTTTTAAPNMYAARVEMRLAQEKQQVLKELLELENQESATASGDAALTAVGEKRKRDEE